MTLRLLDMTSADLRRLLLAAAHITDAAEALGEFARVSLIEGPEGGLRFEVTVPGMVPAAASEPVQELPGSLEVPAASTEPAPPGDRPEPVTLEEGPGPGLGQEVRADTAAPDPRRAANATRGPLWTAEEEARLIKLRGEGRTTKEIAAELGRPWTAVGVRLSELRKRGVEVPVRGSRAAPKGAAAERQDEPLSFDSCHPAGLPGSSKVDQSQGPASAQDGLSVVVLPGLGAELGPGALNGRHLEPAPPRETISVVVPRSPEAGLASSCEPSAEAAEIIPILCGPEPAPVSPQPVASSGTEVSEPEGAAAQAPRDAEHRPVDRTHSLSELDAPAPQPEPVEIPQRLPARRPIAAPEPRPTARLAVVTEAIREIRAADRPVMGGARDFASQPAPAVRSGQGEMRAAVVRTLDKLAHRAPWTPAKDLALVEALVGGHGFGGAAERAKVTEAAARDRWGALTAPIKETAKRRVGPKGQERWQEVRANNVDGQAFLVAELRRRAALADEVAA